MMNYKYNPIQMEIQNQGQMLQEQKNIITVQVTFLYKYICQGCRRFETSVFFSVKINISTTGGFRVGFFLPDTNHP